MAQDYSGFDMKETIAWYERNKAELLVRLPNVRKGEIKTDYPIIRSLDLDMTNEEITALIHLFPKEARERSVLEAILLRKSQWFPKNIAESKKPALKVEDAMSPTHIIPGYTDPQKWVDTKIPGENIELYEIPSQQCPDLNVRGIILAEALLHEFAHTVEHSVRYGVCPIAFPDGTRYAGKNFIDAFAQKTEGLQPITHYSSAYRDEKGKFLDNELFNRDTSIGEELAESVAAYFLGFAFCEEDKRSKNPFADRPEVKKFVEGFLHARRA